MSIKTSTHQRSLGPPIFAYEFHHYKCVTISMSQTQIGENVDNLNNVNSYILAGNYCQLAVQN